MSYEPTDIVRPFVPPASAMPFDRMRKLATPGGYDYNKWYSQFELQHLTERDEAFEYANIPGYTHQSFDLQKYYEQTGSHYRSRYLSSLPSVSRVNTNILEALFGMTR